MSMPQKVTEKHVGKVEDVTEMQDFVPKNNCFPYIQKVPLELG